MKQIQGMPTGSVTRFLALLASAGLWVISFATLADGFPSRPISFVVPWGVGGGSDQTAREIAHELSERLKVAVPVLNVPGATGTIGIAKVVDAPADGYTIGLMAADTYALLVSDPPAQWKDSQLIPLAVMIQQPSAIIVAQNGPYKTWQDMVNAAKQKPDSVSIAVGGVGSPQDITINFLRSQDVRILSVPYAKPGERYTAVLGGQIDGFYEALGNVRGQLDSGKMKPLLIFCSQRTVWFPDVPCSKEVGLNITLPQFRAVVVKAGTDPGAIRVLSDALADVAKSATYKAYLQQQYADEDSYLSQDKAIPFMHQQLDAMGKIWVSSHKP